VILISLKKKLALIYLKGEQ